MGLVSWLLRICQVGTGVAGIALGLLYFFQEKILYVPVIPGVPADYWLSPDRYRLQYEDIAITTSDDVQLHAWLLGDPGWDEEYRSTRPVVMFFQENAGNMCLRLPFLKLLVSELKCSVFAISYRGYGRSQGKPSERGIKLDAEAGLEYLATRPEIGSGRVVIFGRSLGGAVGLYLASKFPHKVKAVVVENTFASVEDMVKRVVPPLGLLIGSGRPLNWLVTNKWRNYQAIKEITSVPILMLVSLQDEIVPPDQMHLLHRIAQQSATHVDLVEFPTARHMDAYDSAPREYWKAVKLFFDTHVE